MNQLERFREVHAFAFDVDGVMTDARVLVMEDGKLLRQTSMRDGYAIKKAVSLGYPMTVISGGRSEGIRERLLNLGLQEGDLYLGVEDKLEAFEEWMDIHQVQWDQVLYMGDDIPDYEIMRRVVFPACPRDAASEIKAIAQYISPFGGGEGCVRDVIEKVLRLRNQWFEE